MRIARVVLVAIAGLVLLGAVAAAGYGLGRAEPRTPRWTREPCQVEAAAYANAGSQGNPTVLQIAKENYEQCRNAHR
jgi:hypothetical protein